MYRVRHVGSRPEGNVKFMDEGKPVYKEEFPDGSYKYWNKKTMNSGCGNVISITKDDIKDGLIYCTSCGDMCNEKQFIEETECLTSNKRLKN